MQTLYHGFLFHFSGESKWLYKHFSISSEDPELRAVANGLQENDFVVVYGALSYYKKFNRSVGIETRDLKIKANTIIQYDTIRWLLFITFDGY